MQAIVLRQMGYPVEIEIRAREEAPPSALPPDPYQQWEDNTFSRLCRLSVTDPAFRDWISTPSALGEQTDWAPSPLAEEIRLIEFGRPREFMKIIKEFSRTGRLENYGVPQWVDLVFLQRCFVAAYERYIEAGNTRLSPGELAENFNLYQELRHAGTRPVNPEQLSMLMRDFYEQYEAATPEFAAFKTRS